jgi:hypothetical protein
MNELLNVALTDVTQRNNPSTVVAGGQECRRAWVDKIKPPAWDKKAERVKKKRPVLWVSENNGKSWKRVFTPRKRKPLL